MTPRFYKIRKSFLIPLGLNAVLLLVLLLLSLFVKGAPTEKVILFAFFLPTALIGLEAYSRRVTALEDGIMIKKFFREKIFQWQDITHVGVMVMRRKIYFLMTTTKGFHVLSNAYDHYPDLLRHLEDHLGPEKVTEDVRQQMQDPISNRSDIIAAWFAATVILGMIILKLYPV
jgi:hypothetical protein